MNRPSCLRVTLSLALVAGLAGCNLLKKQDEGYSEPPPGTKVVPLVPERDMPKNAAGMPIDAGEGPVLQVLGDLTGVDLGKRKGGCTFQHQDGRELLVTGSAADKDSDAIGAVRSGGVIVMLKSQAKVGLDGLKAGPTLSGGNITVSVARAEGKGAPMGPLTRWNANLGVRDASGQQRVYSPGNWTCS
jgi:hypothetical protein